MTGTQPQSSNPGPMDSPVVRSLLALLAVAPVVAPKVDPAVIQGAGQVIVSAAGLVGLIGSLVTTFRHGQRSAS